MFLTQFNFVAMRAWREQKRLRAERLANVRAMTATADADPQPSMTDDEVAEHFHQRAQSAPSPENYA